MMTNPYAKDKPAARLNVYISKADRDYIVRCAPVRGVFSAVVGSLVKAFVNELKRSPDPVASFETILARRTDDQTGSFVIRGAQPTKKGK